tara:strand:- start:1057 stop:1923 length:867 start_codon:yes stop_codon:yes gene_type:complete
MLATNTSSIPLDKISQVMDKPSRLIGIHFFNPVAKMPLIEIVKTNTTPQLWVKKAASFVKQLKRSPLLVMSSPGFLVNRLLMPYLTEAMKIYEEGVSKELIDQTAVNFGMPMGPVELADKVGLDVCLSVAQNLSACSGMEVSSKLEEMVEAGSLGVKTGGGFYRYDKKGKPIRQVKKSEFSNDRERDITDRLVLVLLNEAVACLHEKVVSNADLLDAGMIFGTGFAPFRGGPLQYAKQRGINDIVFRLNELSSQYGERFKPREGWQQLMQESSDGRSELEASLTVEEV